MHYQEKKTIEQIAEILDKDTSTIKRNKKRLILQINDILQTINKTRGK